MAEASIPVHLLDDRTLVRSLRGCICPACGLGKKSSQTLCRTCWAALPRPLGVSLYNRLGDGYQEAVTAAMQRLGKTEFVVTPTL